MSRDNTTVFADISSISNYGINMKRKEGNSNPVGFNGLDLEEQYGLNLEERKRQRSEADENVIPKAKRKHKYGLHSF